jgi:hypothetical protein
LEMNWTYFAFWRGRDTMRSFGLAFGNGLVPSLVDPIWCASNKKASDRWEYSCMGVLEFCPYYSFGSPTIIMIFCLSTS